MPPGASAASRVATLTCSGSVQCQCFDAGQSRQRSPHLVSDLGGRIVQAPAGHAACAQGEVPFSPSCIEMIGGKSLSLRTHLGGDSGRDDDHKGFKMRTLRLNDASRQQRRIYQRIHIEDPHEDNCLQGCQVHTLAETVGGAMGQLVDLGAPGAGHRMPWACTPR